MKINTLVMLLVCAAISLPPKALALEITFEEVYDWDQNGGSKDQLADIELLRTGEKRWLENEEHADWFFGIRDKMPRLYSLDLSQQGIVDDFVKKLCESGFEYLSSIDLSGNDQITRLSLDFIFESDSLGSFRNIPPNSDKYGKTSSGTYVKVSGTRVSLSDAMSLNQRSRSDFDIRCGLSGLYRGTKWVKVIDLPEFSPPPAWRPLYPTGDYGWYGPNYGPAGPTGYGPSYGPTGPTGYGPSYGPSGYGPNYGPPSTWSPYR